MRVSHDGVVLVHDYLTQRGGAERVVVSLARAFPQAPLVTSLYDPSGTFSELAAVDVRSSALQRLPVLRSNHRLGLPLYAPVFSSCRVEAPLTLCSTSGWAHGVRASGKKLLYAYAPARWLYDLPSYLGPERSAVAHVAAPLTLPLRRWDRAAASTADRILTISRRSQRRLHDAWGLDAEVVYPPHASDVKGPARPPEGVDLDPGFLLVVARLLPYKGVDAVLAAMERLPDHRLVVVGDGPERSRLERIRPKNAVLVGRVDDVTLRWLYRHCQALVSAAVEDFGLSPLEAMAYGRPAVVLRGGGFEETVVEGETGLFFDERDPRQIAAAVLRLPTISWSDEALRRRAASFSEETFIDTMRRIVAEMLGTG